METISFYKYNDNFNVINKVLPQPTEIQGILLSNISVLSPTIQIRFTESFSFNYCYLETFQRYYFVESVDYQGDKAILRLQLDVLKTYENEILATIATRVNSSLLSSYSTIYDTTPQKETLQFPNTNIFTQAGAIILGAFANNATKYYKLTDAALNDLAAVKLAKQNGLRFEYIDLTQCAKLLNRVYVNANLLDSVNHVEGFNLGGNYVGIEVDEIENAQKRLNFGSITLPRKNYTTIDEKTKFTLFLPPFGERIEVDNSLQGEAVNLVCDILPNNKQARFALLVDNQEVTSKDVEIANSIDFQSIGYSAYVSENKRVLANSLEPYINMVYYRDVNAPITPQANTTRAQIGSFTGRCAFVDVENISTETMLASEQLKIYSLLKNEVFIK